MKVLHVVSTTLRRGAEMFAAELIGELSNDIDQRVAILSGSVSQVEYPVPVTLLRPDTSGAGLRADPRIALRLHGLASKWTPDVVLAHGGDALKFSVAAGLHRSSRIVYRRIGAVSGWINSEARRRLHRWLIRRAAAVVAVADGIAIETVATFGLDESKVRVIPNGVDPARLAATSSRAETKRALGLPQRWPVIVWIGALSAEKGPLEHIDVATRLRDEGIDVAHLVVGAGALSGALDEAVARNGLTDRVFCCRERSDIGNILEASDLLLLTSRTEGLPGVLIEAGIAGVPAAAFAVGAVSEVVEHGVTGMLARPGNVDELVEGVRTLLNDDLLRERMGQASVEWCEERFGLPAIATAYRALFRELAASPASAGLHPLMEKT